MFSKERTRRLWYCVPALVVAVLGFATGRESSGWAWLALAVLAGAAGFAGSKPTAQAARRIVVMVAVVSTALLAFLIHSAVTSTGQGRNDAVGLAVLTVPVVLVFVGALAYRRAKRSAGPGE